MENLQFLQDQINLLDYIRANNGGEISEVAQGLYNVNPCPQCGKMDHFRVYTDTNSYHSFSHCCEGGKILEYMQEVEGYDKNESIRRLYKMTGYSYQENKENQEKEDYIKTQKKEFLLDGIQNQTQENKEMVYKYLESRGIKNTKELANKYQCFISSNVYEDKTFGTEGTTRLVIPIFNGGEANSYVARAINQNENVQKALNSAGQQIPLNIDYIKKPLSPVSSNNDSVIYICEGWADAFSIEDNGKKAIALNSTSNAKKFIKEIETHLETANQYTYILCCDNDSAGKKARKLLSDEMDKLNIRHISLRIPSEFNDINEWYKNDSKSFTIGLNPFIQDNSLYYLDNQFHEDIIKNEMSGSFKSGFEELDEKLDGGFKPGLVVIGGGSSSGKTTILNEITDNMAEQGHHILYFSLEQSRSELTAKSISRQTLLQGDSLRAESGIQIMQNSSEGLTRKKAIEKYKQFANNIHIIEGNFGTNIKTIRNYIETYISITGNKPVVVIDYLQILKPLSSNDTDKRQVDVNITELKRISRDNNLLIFVISSFNRDNYNNVVDFKSFKESGAIEYSADVILGLQLTAVNDLKGSENDKREILNDAKKQDPRYIELVCLKNRNGLAYFTCMFNFYPKFNYIKEIPKKKQ